MKKAFLISVLLVALTAALVWYLLPIHRVSTVTLRGPNMGEEEMEVAFDWTISRSLLAPPTVRGTIRIGEREYRTWGWTQRGFFENLLRKVKGEANFPAFVNSANLGQGESLLLSDLIYIDRVQFGPRFTIERASIVLTAEEWDGMWSNWLI
ncbi:MAG: hypothetical protein ACSW8F_01665 [bacterium]